MVIDLIEKNADDAVDVSTTYIWFGTTPTN